MPASAKPIAVMAYSMQSRLSLLPLLAALLLFGSCTPAEETVPDRPNILFILADDLGIGDLSSYNPEAKTATPHLNRLAEAGMRFTDAHAPGAWCVPSRYGLLTGRHPHRATMGAWTERALIDTSQSTLASLLRDRGYATYMVGKWHLGFEGGTDYDCSQPLRGGPVDHGFDHYFGIPSSLDIPPYFYIRGDRCVAPPSQTIGDNQSAADIWTDIQGAFWRGGGIAPDFDHRDVLPRLRQETISYLNAHAEQQGDQPFFLYLALTAPHTPWLPPDSLQGTTEAGLYGDFVRHVDLAVGQVLDALAQRGLAENTLVVFTSDNGPVWYTKDEQRFDHRATHVYRGMKGDAWEGGHRMPFIARWPGRIPANTTSNQLLTLTDMLATFADVSGPGLPETTPTDGRNLSLAFQRPQDTTARDDVVHYTGTYLAIREGPWKLIPGLGGGGFITTPSTREPAPGDPPGQLYHLINDPGEQNNVYDAHPEVVARLQTRLERYQEQTPQE
jgi:arylsulfatase A-like enzyme